MDVPPLERHDWSMAHQFVPLYQLSASVGKDGVNQSDDVKLVEALMEVIVRHNGRAALEAYAKRFSLTAPKTDPRVTGAYGADLEGWINLFQISMAKSGMVGKMDGRVDPLPTSIDGALDFQIFTKSGKRYLLFMLNLMALQTGGENFMSIRQKAGVQFYVTIDQQPLRF
jgi:hypothetical protein